MHGSGIARQAGCLVPNAFAGGTHGGELSPIFIFYLMRVTEGMEGCCTTEPPFPVIRDPGTTRTLDDTSPGPLGLWATHQALLSRVLSVEACIESRRQTGRVGHKFY